MPRTPILWQFKQGQDHRWHWERLLDKRRVAARSESFDDYGKCVMDAMRYGFKPNEQGYSTEANGRKTCFRLNEPPETLQP